MSLYAYGKLELSSGGSLLPYPGGFDGWKSDLRSGAMGKPCGGFLLGYWKGEAVWLLLLDNGCSAYGQWNERNGWIYRQRQLARTAAESLMHMIPYLFGSKDEIQDMLNRRIDAVKSHP